MRLLERSINLSNLARRKLFGEESDWFHWWIKCRFRQVWDEQYGMYWYFITAGRLWFITTLVYTKYIDVLNCMICCVNIVGKEYEEFVFWLSLVRQSSVQRSVGKIVYSNETSLSYINRPTARQLSLSMRWFSICAGDSGVLSDYQIQGT